MSGSPIDFEALARFRFLLREFFDFSAKSARAVGVEPRQHQLLLSLRGLAPGTRPTIGALAEQLLIRNHSATEMVHRMEKQGLVCRRHAEDDARVVLVEITRHGQDILDRLSRTHREQLHVSGPALVVALEKLLAAAEHRHESDPDAAGDGRLPK